MGSKWARMVLVSWGITAPLFIYFFQPPFSAVIGIMVFGAVVLIRGSRGGLKHQELERIIKRSPAVAMIWKGQQEWEVEFVSENIKQFGYSPEDLTSGRIPYGRILHPEDRERLQKELGSYEREQRTSFMLSYRILTAEGEVRWVNDWTRSEYDDQGRTARYEGIILDITRRRKAEQALNEEKERLRITMRSIGDGVIATDAEGRVTLINGVAERLTGWSEKEAVGMPLNEIFCLINEHTQKPVEDPVARVLKTGQPCGLANHTALVSRDGTETRIADSAAPIRTDQNQITGVVLVFRDVTIQKETEQERERLLKEMRRNLNNSRALQRITSALLEHISLDDILEIVCRESVRITGSQYSSVYLLKEGEEVGVERKENAENGKDLDLVCWSGGNSNAAEDMAIPTSFLDQVIKAGEPLVIGPNRLQISPEAENILGEETIDEAYGRLAVPLLAGDQRLGVLAVSGKERGFGEGDLRIMNLMATQAAVAIKNATLYHEVQELAVLRERQRLARDLHDAVSQTLFSASLIADALPGIWERDRKEGRRRLDEIRNLSRGALAEMRTLLLELRPDGLTEIALKELVRHLADALQSRSGIEVEVRIDESSSLPPPVQVAFYRIVQESLNNAAKHSSATVLTIQARIQTSEAEMEIRDNGCGFDPKSTKAEALGLKIMAERAQEVGAEFTLTTRPGGGTVITTSWRGENTNEQ